MKPHRILISGAGQIGSRHLQGLAHCRIPLQIYVQDPSFESLKLAQERWDEMAGTANGLHAVSFHGALEGLPETIDLAIVATAAHIRSLVVEQIANQAQVRFWVLEKVLAQSEVALDAIIEAVGCDSRAWVNTPRRMLDWHKTIKSHLPQGRSLTLHVKGGAWGLACNSIHFLDMFAWFTSETLQDIDTSQLKTQWIEAKRAGNWEVMGTVIAKFSGGSIAHLSVDQSEVFYRFELSVDKQVWHIDEDVGTAIRTDGLCLPGRLPFQSEVTATLVESILKGGTCELPTLQESAVIHKVFIRRLLEHWQRNMDPKAVLLPIT